MAGMGERRVRKAKGRQRRPFIILLPQPCIVLIHNPQPVHGFRRVEMSGVPSGVVQPALNFVQPLLGARVDGALVDERQKRLSWLVSQRRGVAEDNVYLPAAM